MTPRRVNDLLSGTLVAFCLGFSAVMLIAFLLELLGL